MEYSNAVEQELYVQIHPSTRPDTAGYEVLRVEKVSRIKNKIIIEKEDSDQKQEEARGCTNEP